MPYIIESRTLNLLRSCVGGNGKSCWILEFYQAIGILEAKIAKELNLEISDVFDVDPDGVAASERFFSVKSLSETGLDGKVKLAKQFRGALSKVVSSLDEEIAGMSKQG